MTTTAIPYHDLIDYEQRAPSILAQGWDSMFTKTLRCIACGKRGLEYHPFTRQQPYDYRPFAVCSSCGHTQEF